MTCAGNGLAGKRDLLVTTRLACVEDFERVAAFYRDNDYRPSVSPADIFILAERDGVLCGVARLCEEEGVLVLRGMRVAAGVQRQGIGTRLLLHLPSPPERFLRPYRLRGDRAGPGAALSPAAVRRLPARLRPGRPPHAPDCFFVAAALITRSIHRLGAFQFWGRFESLNH
jgi:GNAT superfamily N-acetyltransferase